MTVRLNTKALDKFARRRAAEFIRAAGQAGKDELSEMTDGDISVEYDVGTNAAEATIRLTSPTAVIDETGTETRPPDPKISRLIKDRNIRNRIMAKAARTLK